MGSVVELLLFIIEWFESLMILCIIIPLWSLLGGAMWDDGH